MIKEFTIDWKPFIDWARNNDDFEQYELTFIRKCLDEENITGLWSYLIMFFDSVGIQIETSLGVNNLFYPCINGEGIFNYSWLKSRTEAQFEAMKKAFEIHKQILQENE